MENTVFNKTKEVENNEFTIGEKFIINWQYRQLGSFKFTLAEAMARADKKNLSAFAKGFPEEAEAMTKFKLETNWWDNVNRRYLQSINAWNGGV